MTRILLLNRFAPPDPSPTARLLGDLAARLAAAGHAVTVLAGRLGYDDPKTRPAATEIRRGVRIRRLLTTRFGRRRLLGRALDATSFHLAAFLALLVTLRPGARRTVSFPGSANGAGSERPHPPVPPPATALSGMRSFGASGSENRAGRDEIYACMRINRVRPPFPQPGAGRALPPARAGEISSGEPSPAPARRTGEGARAVRGRSRRRTGPLSVRGGRGGERPAALPSRSTGPGSGSWSLRRADGRAPRRSRHRR